MSYQQRFNVEELRTWTSKEAAHSLPAQDRPSILPARYALTPCSRHPLRHARSAPVSRSSQALGLPGTATRLRQTLIVTEGLGRVQRWGGPIEEIGPGDVIWFPPWALLLTGYTVPWVVWRYPLPDIAIMRCSRIQGVASLLPMCATSRLMVSQSVHGPFGTDRSKPLPLCHPIRRLALLSLKETAYRMTSARVPIAGSLRTRCLILRHAFSISGWRASSTIQTPGIQW